MQVLAQSEGRDGDERNAECHMQSAVRSRSLGCQSRSSIRISWVNNAKYVQLSWLLISLHCATSVQKCETTLADISQRDAVHVI